MLMSRNISGGPVVDVFMGGLNHQVEHHLYPSMPRPHLRKAQPLVAAYCVAQQIPYTQRHCGSLTASSPGISTPSACGTVIPSCVPSSPHAERASPTPPQTSRLGIYLARRN